MKTIPKINLSKFLAISLILFLLISACSDKNIDSNFTVYRSQEQNNYLLESNFSIKHPPGWKILTPSEILGFVVAPPDYQNSNVKVSIIIFPLELVDESLYNLGNEDVLNRFAPIFELDKAPENIEKLTINNTPAERFYTESGQFINEIVVIGKGKSRFVIGGYATIDNQSERNLMETIINSFEITE